MRLICNPCLWQCGIATSRNFHIAKHLNRILLQTGNVDRALLGRVQITATHAQIGSGTDHATGQPVRIVRHDHLRGAVKVFVGNSRNERLRNKCQSVSWKKL